VPAANVQLSISVPNRQWTSVVSGATQTAKTFADPTFNGDLFGNARWTNEADTLASLESQSRYITRPALAMDALEKLDDGTLSLETPPDPRTGATRVVLNAGSPGW